jgi:hypothetical protein
MTDRSRLTGGRIKGDITQAEAAFRQRKAEAENLRGQIDYDVRTATALLLFILLWVPRSRCPKNQAIKSGAAEASSP